MSYVVLARKFRPQSFEDLVGQEHVSTTIANAIAQDRVAHAFLFTGVRGVGKTTSARILAKALNCAKGPTATPCQECPQCREITAGNDLDVQEIDGASYTGIEDVRRLQSTLGPLPARDRFKIFIVDEVHMLSNSAWNAFLKTLEEPPPHVKFIFATTEVHKVPVTILSRCQRYDFKLISAQMVATRLREVLDKEGIAAEDGAIKIIAREAAGSMRDAMSLLDQVIAWIGVESDKLTAEGVAKVLGVAERSVHHRLAEAVITGDAASCVRIVGDLAQQGYDLAHTARDFLSHLRDLVVAKVADDPAKLLDLGDEEIADARALASKSDVDDLTRLHQGFSKSFDDIVRSGQPRASLEMALVRLARRPALLPVDEMLRRLADLERRLGGGGPDPRGGGGGARGGAPGPGGPPARPGGRPGYSADPAPSPAPPPRPQHAQPAPSAQSAQHAATPPFVPPSPPPAAEAPPPAVAAPPARPAPPPSPSPPPPRPQHAAPPPFVAPSTPPFVAPSMPSPAAPRRPSTPPPASARPSVIVPARPAAQASPESIEAWRAVLTLVRAKRPALASVLEHAAILAFGPDRVELGYEAGSFLVGQATDPVAKELLLASLTTHFGRAPELVFDVIASKSGNVTVAMMDTADRKLKLDAAKLAVANHPLVTAAIELLGAELKDVRLADADAS